MESMGDTEIFYTVFEGSAQEDVAYAKVFWSSLCLQPPMESSLVAADITQRLKRAKNPHSTSTVPKPSLCSESVEILQRAYQLQIQDEKQRYLEMAKKRDEIVALLKKQRESRIEALDPFGPLHRLLNAIKAGYDLKWFSTANQRSATGSGKKEMVSLPHKPRRPEPAERLSHSLQSEALHQDVREVHKLV